MADTQVTFDILARDRASRPLRNIGDNADRTSERFRRFGKVSAKTAKVAGAAVGGALVGIAVGLGKAAKAAASEEQEMALLANALKKNAKANATSIKATEKWITATQNATGVADGDLRPALAKLVGATKDTAKAQQLLKVGLDFSASSGKSLDSVATALTKAYNGNVGALGRLGVKVQDSTKDAVAYKTATINVHKAETDLAAAIKEHGRGSDEAKVANDKLALAQLKMGEALGKVKKQTISFDEAMQRLTKQFGGSAATAAETTAGRYAILKARFADLVEEVGFKVLPVLNRLMSLLSDKLIPAAGDLAKWFREKVLPALRQAGEYVRNRLIPVLADTGQRVLPLVTSAGRDLVHALNDLRKAFGVSTDGAKNSEGAMNNVRLTMLLLATAVKVVALNFRSFALAVRILMTPFRLIVKLLNNLTNAVIPAFVAAWDKLTHLPKPDLHLPGLPSLPKPHIPGLATGGTATRSGLAMVGERGAEVVRLGRGDSVFPHGTGPGGGITIENLNVTSGPGERAEYSVPRALRRVVWAF